MRILFLCALALAGCGNKTDRLSDEQTPTRIGKSALPQAAAPADSTTTAYKARGTEPGWALTIDGGTMSYEGDYGSVKISEPTPVNFRAAPGHYDGTRLKLAISAGPCSDGMSDLVYRQTVRLVADGKTVEGCGGGTVAPDGLAGTNWTVIAINGRATPGGAGYFLNFDASQLSAKFGCNSIGGGYRVNGDHLSTTFLNQTEMACTGPEGAFESQGTAVLTSNMRVEPTGGDKMRLVSEAGSIDLRRAI